MKQGGFLSHCRRPDLMLLGLGLPEIGGLAVCRQIHVIDLSGRCGHARGRDEELEVVVGLDAGAIDYVRPSRSSWPSCWHASGRSCDGWKASARPPSISDAASGHVSSRDDWGVQPDRDPLEDGQYEPVAGVIVVPRG